MRLDEFPRLRLAHLPTPLEPLPRLSEYLGGPRIFIKRDEQTGLAMGGNKARKLEFLLADAVAEGCDTVVTTGGPQSNHARQTAAAAARMGLSCELVLPRAVPYSAAEYEHSGNVLLNRLCGAKMEFPWPEDFSSTTLSDTVARLQSQGKRPYLIPLGGSNPLGSLGYVQAVDELLGQARRERLSIDKIVVATGSAGTHSGVVAGLTLAKHPALVQGFAVSGKRDDKERLVCSLAAQTLGLLSAGEADLKDRVHVDDGFVGLGYGLPTDAMVEAVRITAQLEGVLLDPVYTGKAMAGLIAAIRAGQLNRDETVVFWHTGGTPALFAYQAIF